MAFIITTLTCQAQFEQGKYYVAGSLTGLNLSYSGAEKLSLGLEAKAGYLFEENWMLTAQATFQHSGDDNIANSAQVGLGFRYYIVQNGLYLGANAKLLHANHSYNDLMPGVEVGYAFFLNHHVTVEPALYYDQSFKSHSDYSTIGFTVGLGIYL